MFEWAEQVRISAFKDWDIIEEFVRFLWLKFTERPLDISEFIVVKFAETGIRCRQRAAYFGFALAVVACEPIKNAGAEFGLSKPSESQFSISIFWLNLKDILQIQ